MADLNISRYERVRAEEFWASMLDSEGDPETVLRLLNAETVEDTPGQFARVMGVTTALHFAYAWPIVLQTLADCGVSHKDMLQEIERGLEVTVGDYLRRDVEPDEVV